MNDIFIDQLEDVIAACEDALKHAESLGADEGFGEERSGYLHTRLFSVIERIAGRNSVYYENAREFYQMSIDTEGWLKRVCGVSKSLLHDMKNGYLKSFEEVIHSDLFSDFLEMAEHLNENGFKDAAAVIAGSTLEAHLRMLCEKNKIEIELENGKPKSGDALNVSLVKEGVYSKLEQKSVTAWFGQRNKAAHGHYEAYDNQQVALNIDSIRAFIGRNPA
ncbi:hypothetical protein [Gimesia alba]|nr:hypothetical protein [Gimesia alba]